MTISNGKLGERIGGQFCRRQGYVLLAENFHCREGELDLVMQDNDSLVFCEVKLRTSSKEKALASVSRAKQTKLVLAAAAYLAAHPELQDMRTRFDVLAVVPRNGNWEVHHLPDAFRPD